MADEEQLAILKQGAKVWNKWREKNPSIEVDLREADFSKFNLSSANLTSAKLSGVNLFEALLAGADLSVADLRGATLHFADLRGATLHFANLNGADLGGAFLYKADLRGADLIGANLRGADLLEANLGAAHLDDADLNRALLPEADLRGAHLRGAKLCGADLRGVHFHFAELEGSNFLEARIGNTTFGGSDLSQIIGLEKIVHVGPSTIGIDTFALSKREIPNVFLRGCGLSDADIQFAKLSNPDLSNEEIDKILYRIHDLRAGQALQVSPLFISYSHADSAFVDKLEVQLNGKGIRFWRDIHEMRGGRIETQIDRGIRQNPTVLLVLSEHSLESDWVEHEVRTARGLEKEMERDVLCPVALDDSWKNSKWEKRIMEQVMKYNILDFSEWQDDSKFDSIFRKLIDGLELFYKS